MEHLRCVGTVTEASETGDPNASPSCRAREAESGGSHQGEGGAPSDSVLEPGSGPGAEGEAESGGSHQGEGGAPSDSVEPGSGPGAEGVEEARPTEAENEEMAKPVTSVLDKDRLAIRTAVAKKDMAVLMADDWFQQRPPIVQKAMRDFPFYKLYVRKESGRPYRLFGVSVDVENTNCKFFVGTVHGDQLCLVSGVPAEDIVEVENYGEKAQKLIDKVRGGKGVDFYNPTAWLKFASLANETGLNQRHWCALCHEEQQVELAE